MQRILFLLLWLCCGTLHAEDFLDPEVAFKSSARLVDGNQVVFHFEIADGYYLYRERFRFSTDTPGAQLGQPVFPAGKIKHDDNFGDVEVYAHQLDVRLPLERSNAAGRLDLNLVLQGCAEAGLCYPPQPRKLSVELPATGAASATTSVTTPVVATVKPAATTTATGDETSQIAQSLKSAGFFTNLLFFFLAGLGLSLTPCVFPMIPILSGIIAGQGGSVSRRRGFTLSLAYVLGMALTYSAAGVAAGLSGTLISSALQTPWVLGSFAMVFVALSLSMFGFYDLQLPSALQSRLSESAGNLQGGRSIGVFVMGALSALIVGPCVAAPLAGALLYIGQTGNAVLGGMALFAMAIGMGVPLLLIGLSAGTLLPRAGVWMENVKKFFGVLLLGTALWLVSPVIPAAVQMLGWALLLIIPAVYLNALEPLPAPARGWARFWKGLGLVLLIAGAAQLIGALAGNRDPLQPLAGLHQAAGQQTSTPHLPFQRISSVEELNARLQSAGKPVMLDFYADWCAACKEMERLTFSDPSVQARLSGYLLLQADVTGNSEQDKALLKKFGLFGPPGIIFFNPQSEEVSGKRVVGFQDVPRFLQTLEGI